MSRIYVRFVSSDHSINDGRYKGVVTNPEISIESNDQFKRQIEDLVNRANSSRTYADLQILDIVYENDLNQSSAVQVEDGNKIYRNAADLIKAIADHLKFLEKGTNPKFDWARKYIKDNKINLSLICT